MFKRLKKWWQELALIKCDYCGKKVKYAYDACILPVKEYKGNEICTECVKSESVCEQKNMVYTK